MNPSPLLSAPRKRAVYVATGFLLLGMVAISFYGAVPSGLLSAQMKLHEPRPVLNILLAVSDGSLIYTINGAPAYTFKEDTAFSPPKGDSNFMKSHPIEGCTLVGNTHINGTFTHVINGIGLPLYTRLDDSPDLPILYALNQYYDAAFSTGHVRDFSSRVPALGSSWLYLPFRNGTQPLDASANVAVYDVDLRDVTSQQISALKNAGSVVICRIIAGAALEHFPGSAHVTIGDSVLPKSVTVGPVPGKTGEHFLNTGLPSVKHAMELMIERAAASGCDGTEYMLTQFTSYQLADAVEPEELAYHQWLTQKARSQKLFSVLRNEGSLTASYGSSYDALVQQNMFLVKSDTLASVFSSQNKPVFNVEDVEKYGFGAIPECTGRINVMMKCVQSILSKVRTLESSHRNICEKSRDMFTSTIFRTLSANGNPEVMTCSPSLMSSGSPAASPAAAVKSLLPSPSRTMPDGMGGISGSSGWFSAAHSLTASIFLTLSAMLACTASFF